MTKGPWRWEHRHGPAALLHDITPPAEFEPTAWRLEVDEATLVLGSSQPPGDVDSRLAAAAGLQIARRRSGGGAVLLVPGEHVWIDVWVPAGTRWWREDLSESPQWLAAVWIEALASIGFDSLTVHRTPMAQTRWSRQVCFAGVGAGEVSAGAQKLVGLSQRRTREWARFQCVVHRRWDAPRTFAALSDPEAGVGGIEWKDRVGNVGDRDVAGAFAAALEEA